MTYYALAGAFTIAGKSPDGDTICFQPDRPQSLWALQSARRLDPAPSAAAKTYQVSVRLEGIDAPELHYDLTRQRRAATARTRLLHRLGLRDLTFVGDTVPHAHEQRARGWIIAKEVDVRGRVIGLAYRGSDLPLASDAPLALDRATLLRSANADMLSSGAAYHLAYTTLERAHRKALHALATAARKARRGVWSHDSTRAFPFRGLASVCERGALVFPKLFRRCVDFSRDTASRVGAAELVEWLRETPGKDDWLEVDRKRVRLSALLTAGRERVRCAADPMAIVFEPTG